MHIQEPMHNSATYHIAGYGRKLRIREVKLYSAMHHAFHVEMNPKNYGKTGMKVQEDHSTMERGRNKNKKTSIICCIKKTMNSAMKQVYARSI